MPRANRLAVAGLSKRGWLISCCIITGAPLNWVQRSVSISRNASSTSHLYMITMRRPLRSMLRNCDCKPLTWNSGKLIKAVGCRPDSMIGLIRSGDVMPAKAPW